MRTPEKIMAMIYSGAGTEVILQKVRWRDLNNKDCDDLLQLAMDLREKKEGFNLLLVLHKLAYSNDAMYASQVLSLVLDRQDINRDTREKVITLLGKHLQAVWQDLSSDQSSGEKLLDYFFNVGCYYSALAGAQMFNSPPEVKIRFLQSSYDAYQLSNNLEKAQIVEKQIYGLTNGSAISQQQSRQEELQKNLTLLTQKVTERNEELFNSEKNLEIVTGKINANQQMLKDINYQIAASQAKTHEQNSLLNSINNSIEEKRKELGVLGKIKSVHQLLPELEQRKLQFEAAINILVEQERESNQDISKAQEKYAELLSSITKAEELVSQNKQLELVISQNLTILDNLKAENERTDIQYQQKAQMRQEIEALAQEKSILQSEVDNMESQASQLRSLQKKSSALQKKVTDLQSRIDILSKNRENLEIGNNIIEEKIGRIETQLNSYQKESQNAAELLLQKNNVLTHNLEELENLRKEKKELEESIRSLKRKKTVSEITSQSDTDVAKTKTDEQLPSFLIQALS